MPHGVAADPYPEAYGGGGACCRLNSRAVVPCRSKCSEFSGRRFSREGKKETTPPHAEKARRTCCALQENTKQRLLLNACKSSSPLEHCRDGTQTTFFSLQVKSSEATLNFLGRWHSCSCHRAARVFSSPTFSPQQQGWDAIMGDVADVRSVLFLYCPEGVLEQRLLSRGKSSGRTDDNAETAKRRFQTYVQTTLPVSQSQSQPLRFRQT